MLTSIFSHYEYFTADRYFLIVKIHKRDTFLDIIDRYLGQINDKNKKLLLKEIDKIFKNM